MTARIPAWALVLAVLAFAFLAGHTALLWLNYDALPERFPTHYGISGAADAFRAKTPGRVFGLPVLGFATWSLLWFNVWAVAHGMRPGSSLERQQIAIRMMAAIATLTSILMTLTAAAPLNHGRGIPGGPWIMGALVIGTLVAAIGGTFALNRAPDTDGDTPPECWHAGFYYNRADPALMLTRRDGLGITANFAHPLAWVYPAVLVVIFGAIFWMVR